MSILKVLPTTSPVDGGAPAAVDDGLHAVTACASSAVDRFGGSTTPQTWTAMLQRIRDGLRAMDANCAQVLESALHTPQGSWDVYGQGAVGELAIGSFIADVEHGAFRVSRTLLDTLGMTAFRSQVEDVAVDELLLHVPLREQTPWLRMLHDVVGGLRIRDLHHDLVRRGTHRMPALTIAGPSHPLPGSGRRVVMGVVVTHAPGVPQV